MLTESGVGGEINVVESRWDHKGGEGDSKLDQPKSTKGLFG